MEVSQTEADLARHVLRHDPVSRNQRIQIFLRWCLQREALRGWNYILLLTPVLISGYFIVFLASRWSPGLGLRLQQYLWGIASLCLFLGGVRHASGAVCWEVSDEMRDLVRLTDFDPASLIWCKSLCRWWTIFISLFLVFPLVLFVLTNGALNHDLIVAAGSWLVLLAVLTGGFAMIASVSSNQASNAETTAATATFLMMLLYHVLFWGLSAFVVLGTWISSGVVGQPPINLLNLAPITGVYRAISSPGTFSCLDVSYWLHLLTGGVCIWAATVVMRNRFRVTTQGDDLSTERTRNERLSATPARIRPRCTDQPFLWKDQYILGGGRRTRLQWMLFSLFALVGVIAATFKGFPLVAGIVAACAAPCLVSVGFDNLLAVEFRYQTWNSLMFLPVDPLRFLLAKLQAAAWERQGLLLPVISAMAVASFANPAVMLMVATIALLVGIVITQISVLNQFYAKTWWIVPLTSLLIIGMIFSMLAVWATASSGVSFIITLISLSFVNGFLFRQIRWRLDHWIDA